MSGEPESLTVREISRRTGIPESTLRYYRDVFPDRIPTVGRGRHRRHPAAAVAVYRRIAELFAAGESRAGVRRRLANARAASPEWGSEPADAADDDDAPTWHGGVEVSPAYALERAEGLGGLQPRDLEGLLSAMLMRDRELMAMQRELINLVERLVHVFGSLAAGQGAGWLGRPGEALPPPRVGTEDDDRGASEPVDEPVDSEDLERLRQSLEREREMVERLRRARLELEQRLTRLEREGGGGSASR